MPPRVHCVHLDPKTFPAGRASNQINSRRPAADATAIFNRPSDNANARRRRRKHISAAHLSALLACESFAIVPRSRRRRSSQISSCNSRDFRTSILIEIKPFARRFE